MIISILIATRNRCQSLRTSLTYVRQTAARFAGSSEVIVIDNGSEDDTSNIVSQFGSEWPGIIRYIYEPRKGKSIALNSGIASSRGEILVFTDDDCYPTPSWLSCIAAEFRRDETLGGLGGRAELFDKADANIGTRTAACRAEVRSVSEALFTLIGCNMAFRRQVIDRVGPFDCHLGPGTGVIAEDMDYLYRVYRTGEKLAYVPEVLVYHNHGRRPGKAVDRLIESYTLGRGAVYGKHVSRGDRLLAREAYWELCKHLKRVAQRDNLSHELRLLRYLLTGITKGIGVRMWSQIKSLRNEKFWEKG
jgi:glycosyltransferase involved in cell wall biosynthesis